MNIYYQWAKWAYSYINATNIQNKISGKSDKNDKVDKIIWLDTFSEVWKKIKKEWWIWVVPIENSYAGPIHENLYKFLHYDFKIIGEIFFEVNHCLLSKETDISKINKTYSHTQALSQCYNYLEKNKIKWVKHLNTASSAEMISKNNEKWVSAIASKEAWKIYWLNILEEKIQDQNWNKTRFFIIAKKESKIKYLEKAWKISIIFELKNDIPAGLYKCLWAFATNDLNLTKIESLPNPEDWFNHIFWLDFEWNMENKNVKKALNELKFFTKKIRILGDY